MKLKFNRIHDIILNARIKHLIQILIHSNFVLINNVIHKLEKTI